MELKTVFIDNNSDMECLDTISKSLPSEVLEKAFDSSKLVQKEITDKNGHRKKVWIMKLSS